VDAPKAIRKPRCTMIINPGDKFGRLTTVERVFRKPRWRWLCQCDCGAQTIVASHNLLASTNSCGCWRRDRLKSHGLTECAEYWIWVDIKQRCLNPKSRSFVWYGARGITVCDEWRDSFQAFYDYVGPRPSRELSIDRKNNDGNYEPGNVRWATASEQARNQRRPKQEAASAAGA